MSIKVTCVQCGSSHLVNDRLAGRRVRCPNCETAVHVAEPDVDLGSSQAETGGTAEALPVGDVDPASGVGGETVDFGSEQPLQSEPPSGIAQPLPAAAAGVAASGIEGSPEAETPVLADQLEEEDDEVLPRKERAEEEMDMTPMVDVTFLLLIFFMVTAAFSLQKSIEMPRQQTDAPSTSVIEEESEELDMVEVQVDEFGSFLVMAPDWERETPGKQNLITALKEAMLGNNSGMRLVIKVHELAKLNSLVDAMDAGTIAGYAELEVTQVEEFD